MRAFFGKVLQRQPAPAAPAAAPADAQPSDEPARPPRSPGGSFSRGLAMFRRSSSANTGLASPKNKSTATTSALGRRKTSTATPVRPRPANLAHAVGKDHELAAGELDAGVKLAEEVVPALLVESLRERAGDLRGALQLLGGHVRIAARNKSKVVTLQDAGKPVEGLSFQTLDVLERIACSVEDGPDACAAVGLPACLLDSLAMHHGVRFKARDVAGAALETRRASVSSDGLGEQGLVEDQLTASESEGESELEDELDARRPPRRRLEDRDKPGSRRIRRSEAVFRRVAATLCHLMGHVAVLLSLIREQDAGLDKVFALVLETGGSEASLSLLEAMTRGPIAAVVLEYIVERKLLQGTVESMRSAGADLNIAMLSAVAKLLRASCRTSQALLVDFRDHDGYLLVHEALRLLPEQTERLLGILRTLVYLGPGFAEAEAEAELRGATHSVFLARNDHAFAVIVSLLCNLQYRICGEDPHVKQVIWEHHAQAWKLVAPARGELAESLEPIEDPETLRLPLLHCVLTIYSSNPTNFGLLDENFGVMTTLLVSLGGCVRVHDEFLFMVIKLLELISMGMDYRPAQLLQTIAQITLPTLLHNRGGADGTSGVSRREASLSYDLGAEEKARAGSSAGAGEEEEDQNPAAFVSRVLCKTLVKMVRSEDEYKDMLREAGLLSEVIFPILRIAATCEDPSAEPEIFDPLPLWCMLLCDMLESCPRNEEALREAQVHRTLYDLLPRAPKPTLSVLLQLSRRESAFVEQDLSALLELVQRLRTNPALEVDILSTIVDMMRRSHRVKDLLRKLGGFESLLAILLSQEDSFGPGHSEEDQEATVQLMDAVFKTITTAMTGNHQANRAYLRDEIRYESISSTCHLIGIFGSRWDHRLVDMVISCTTEAAEVETAAPESLRIRNVDPLEVLTLRLGLLSEQGLHSLLSRIVTMVHGTHGEQAANCEILAGTSLPQLLLGELFDSVLCDPAHQMHEAAVVLLGSLTRHSATSRAIRPLFDQLFRVLGSDAQTSAAGLLRVLDLAANPGNDDAFFGPYVQMSGPSDVLVSAQKDSTGQARKLFRHTSDRSVAQHNAAGNLHIAGLGKRSWPPASGYTLSMWVWLGADVGEEVLLASIRNSDGLQLLRVSLEQGDKVVCHACGDGPRPPEAAVSSPVGGSGKAGAGTKAAVTAALAAAEAGGASLATLLNRAVAPSPGTGKGGAGAGAGAGTLLTSHSSAELHDFKRRILRDLAPNRLEFPSIGFETGRWHHVMLVHRLQSNMNLLLDKSLNGRMTLFLDGVEVASSKFPYPATIPNGGLKTSVFVGVDPILAATRSPTDHVRYWRLGPMLLLDAPKDCAVARSLYILGVNYRGTLSRSCATLRDARSFTTVLLERLAAICADTARGSDADRHAAAVEHLERLNLPDACWKELLQRNSAFLNEKGSVELESIVFAFHGGRRTTLDGFKTIDATSLIQKQVREIEVPRTALVNTAMGGEPGTGQQPILAVLGGGAFAITPLPLCESVRSVGGIPVVLRLLELSQEPAIVELVLRLLCSLLSGHEYNRFSFRQASGHRVLAWLLFRIAQQHREVFTPAVFEAMLNLAVYGTGRNALIVDPEMLHQLVLNHQVWRGTERENEHRWRFVIIILQWLSNLVDEDNLNVLLNLDALHRLNIIDWVLEIMLSLAVDIPAEEGLVSDVLAAALQFLHNLNKQKLVRRALFELFKHILVSLPTLQPVDENEDGEPAAEAKALGEEDPPTTEKQKEGPPDSPPRGPSPPPGAGRPGRRRQRRRRTVTDMMLHTGKKRGIKRMQHLLKDELLSERGEVILRKVRCMLFQLLLELPGTVPETVDPGRHRALIFATYSDILSVHWFTCVLNPELDRETFLLAVRLLVEVLQESPEFARHFINTRGFDMLSSAAAMHPDLPSVLMSLIVPLYGMPVSCLGPAMTFSEPHVTPKAQAAAFREDSEEEDEAPGPDASEGGGEPGASTTSPPTPMEEGISSFVSPAVKRRLLSRKSTLDADSSVQVVQTDLVATFQSLAENVHDLAPPTWAADVYACIFGLLKPLVSDQLPMATTRDDDEPWTRTRGVALCVDVVRLLSNTLQRYPEVETLFAGSRAIGISSELIFAEAQAAGLDLAESDGGAFAGPVAQAVLRLYVELLCLAVAEDGPLTRPSLAASGHGSSSASASHGATGVGDATGGAMPDSSTPTGADAALAKRARRARDSRKLLESIMQSFPNSAPPEHCLWFQSALVQAMLPTLSLMLDDKTWAARASSGSMMKLPHNADPVKLVSTVCFVTGRASFGWVPGGEHTVLELVVQAYHCMTGEDMRNRILRCIRGLVLWSLYTSACNETVPESVQFLHAVLRNIDVLQMNTFFSSLVPTPSSTPSEGFREPYIPSAMIPESLRKHFNLYDESAVFCCCLVHMLVLLLSGAPGGAREPLEELLLAVLENKRDLFQHDPPLANLLAAFEAGSRDGAPGLDEPWLSRLWVHAQRIELFGSPSQCGLLNKRGSGPPAASPTATKRAQLRAEVETIKTSRRERSKRKKMEAPEQAVEHLRSESKGLMLGTQRDAVERHNRWQRVGLEHLLRGKRCWLAQGDTFRHGAFRHFFSPPEANLEQQHWMLDCSEGKDRMRRRTEIDLAFEDTYVLQDVESEEDAAAMIAADTKGGEGEDAEDEAAKAEHMEEELNMVLRSLRHTTSQGPSRLRSLTEVEDLEDDEGAENGSADKDSGGGGERPKMHRKSMSLQISVQDLADDEDSDAGDDGASPTPSADAAAAAAAAAAEAEAAKEQEEAEHIEEHVDADAHEVEGVDDIAPPGGMPVSPRAGSRKSFAVPQQLVSEDPGNAPSLEDASAAVLAETSLPPPPPPPPPPLPPALVAGASDPEQVSLPEPNRLGEGSKTANIASPASSVGSRATTLLSAEQVSIENEMAALGWANAERLLTELDQADRKPEKTLNCAEVNGLESIDGLCMVCAQSFYFATHYQVLENGSVQECEDKLARRRVFDVVRKDGYVRILPSAGGNRASAPTSPRLPGGETGEAAEGEVAGAPTPLEPAAHTLRKVRYDQICEVYRRRYMFREVGLELFAVDGVNFLLVFETPADRDWTFTKILSKELPNLVMSKSTEMKGLAQSTLLNPEIGSSLGALMAPWRRFRASVTRKWRDGEISNFAYLMYLNTLAGRSHNDLTQYPVFPWVLRSYDKATIDLEDPASFRDLSKPMGALNAERAKQFSERYASLESVAAETQIKPFHYGTHYSCSAYVLQFLIRLEPFTHMALELQGGQFDRPDRLFHSFEQSWRSVSGEDFNAQDVRELIPEFFYLPDFLENKSRFDLGRTQRGKRVDDVELPKWSRGDPRRFVRLHRRALESKHVSEHLHEWIDLIFGYKQRGRAAIEAQNVFHPLTYEGEVDPDEIEDPLLRKATLAQIHNFGQTPRKIFGKPHPKRVVPDVAQDASVLLAEPSAVQWHAKLAPPLVVPGAFRRPALDGSEVLGAEPRPGHVALVRLDNITVRAASAGGARSVSELDLSGTGERAFAVSGSASIVRLGAAHYLSWGTEDGSLRLHALTTSALNYSSAVDKVVAVFEALHNGLITACAVTSDGKLVWTGGADALVGVWRLRRHKGKGTGWILDKVEYLSSHTGRVTCLATSQVQGVAVSGAKDCSAVVWDLDKKRFIRRLTPRAAPIAEVGINDGNANVLLLSATELSYWHINGAMLASVQLEPVMRGVRLGAPTAALCTGCDDFQDGIVAVTGHAEGLLALWDCPEDAEEPHLALRSVLKTDHAAPVTALALDAAGRRVACGDAQGNVQAWVSAEAAATPANKASEFFTIARR